jgi:hypothetical protein
VVATIGVAVSIVAAYSAGAMLWPAIDAWQDCNRDIWAYPNLYVQPLVITAIAVGLWFASRALAANKKSFDAATWVSLVVGSIFLFPVYFFNFMPWSDFVAEFRQGCGISDGSSALHTLITYAPLGSIALARLVCPARIDAAPRRFLLMGVLMIVLWLGLAALPF